jgi:hypothetical protein
MKYGMFFVLGLILNLANTSSACDVETFQLTEEQKAEADIVFIGTIQAYQSPKGVGEPAIATYRVDKVIRGAVQGAIMEVYLGQLQASELPNTLDQFVQKYGVQQELGMVSPQRIATPNYVACLNKAKVRQGRSLEIYCESSFAIPINQGVGIDFLDKPWVLGSPYGTPCQRLWLKPVK